MQFGITYNQRSGSLFFMFNSSFLRGFVEKFGNLGSMRSVEVWFKVRTIKRSFWLNPSGGYKHLDRDKPAVLEILFSRRGEESGLSLG